MSTRSGLLRDVDSLDGAAAALRQEYEVDRVSIARYSSDHATFEIVGCAGKVLLSPGVNVPTVLSTQMEAPALGDVFVEASFRDAPRWNRPVDELMLGIGFQSGCSLPLRCSDGSSGAVSLSVTQPHRSLERCVDALAPLVDELADRLTSARPEQVLVCHDDVVIAEGIARLVERGGLTTATCVDARSALRGQLPAGPWLCVLAGPFIAGRPITELTSILERAGQMVPLVIVTEADSVAARQIATIADAEIVAVTGRTEAELKRALTSARAWRGPGRRHDGAAQSSAVRLSPREGDVLLDLDDGLRFKEIARRRGIREPTAKSYARTLFEKLDAHSRTEAVNHARELGLLSSLRFARGDR
jgi:DNA-binding NarL/FixJ family response regulator